MCVLSYTTIISEVSPKSLTEFQQESLKFWREFRRLNLLTQKLSLGRWVETAKTAVIAGYPCYPIGQLRKRRLRGLYVLQAAN